MICATASEQSSQVAATVDDSYDIHEIDWALVTIGLMFVKNEITAFDEDAHRRCDIGTAGTESWIVGKPIDSIADIAD